MNEEKLARFEANIERLVENTFASFFGKRVRAQDIALQLARAMEGGVRPSSAADARLIAPDHFVIQLSPAIHTYLTQHQPLLPQALSQHLVTLATQVGYRMTNAPIVELAASDTLDGARVIVTAAHSNRPENSTAGMQRVEVPVAQEQRRFSAHLLINSERAVRLHDPIINIGRARDNDIILDDPYVSRHHVQLRQRFGTFMLFDVRTQSGSRGQGGTLVNGVAVREHRLQSGDVVQLGRTSIVYMEDAASDDPQLPQTDALEPLH